MLHDKVDEVNKNLRRIIKIPPHILQIISKINVTPHSVAHLSPICAYMAQYHVYLYI